MGTFTGTSLSWDLVGWTLPGNSTTADPNWIGDFTGNGTAEVLYYSSADQNWWLLTWLDGGGGINQAQIGNTTGFGNTASNPTWVGDFTRSGKTEILFYAPGPNYEWWLGTFSGTSLHWAAAANTSGFGEIEDNPFWIGDFTGSSSEILFTSDVGSGWDWWLGRFAGTQLSWILAETTQ